MAQANIFIYTHPSESEIGIDGTEQFPVDDFKIDDQVVIANKGGEKMDFSINFNYGN